MPDPTAMIVATVDEHGQPYQGTVLLKQYDSRGIKIFTNLNSKQNTYYVIQKFQHIYTGHM